MRKIISLFLISLFLFLGQSYALEIVRQKNTATYIVFPIVDADGDIVTAAAGLDSEIDTFSDTAAPNGFVDCTNEATEIGTTGIYYLLLTAAEMNADYIYIQIKTTTTGAKTQHILIRTITGDPLNLATTDDGGAINVTAGAIDATTSITNGVTVTTNNDKTGYSLTQSFPANFADLAITATTGKVTVGTNDDKTGYNLSATAIDAIWDELQSGHTVAGSFGKYLDEAISGIDDNPWDDVTRTITGGTIDTNNDKTGYSISGTKTTLDALNDITAASVWSVVTRSLTDKAGFSLSAAGIDAIWDEVITGHTTVDSFGKVFDDQIDGLRTYGDTNWATATGFSTHSAADVWSVATRALTDKTGFSLSASGIDSIWDELQSGHTIAGSFGYYLDAQVSGATAPTTAQVADAVWDEATADHQTAGTTGKALTDAGAAGNPWATDISTGYTGQAGEYLRNVYNATDGDKEAGSYTGIEKLIRIHR